MKGGGGGDGVKGGGSGDGSVLCRVRVSVGFTQTYSHIY